MNKIYIEDLSIGDIFTSKKFNFTRDNIKAFANEFDPQDFHCNESRAKHSFFKELVASGLHTNAVTMKLITQSFPLAHGIIGAGMAVDWYCPVKPEDSVFVKTEVINIRPCKTNSLKVLITCHHDLYNQNGILCQRLTSKLLNFKKS